MGDSDLTSHILGGGQVTAGQARRDCGDSNRFGTELVVGQLENKSAVDTTGKGHEGTIESLDQGRGPVPRVEVLLDGPTQR